MSNDYTNPNTNPKTLTASILTLTYPDDAFESFCALAFFDFILNYSRTDVCPPLTSYFSILSFFCVCFLCFYTNLSADGRLSASHFVFGYLLISSSFTRMLTYSKLKYIINYYSFIDV